MLSQPDAHGRPPTRWLSAALACALAAWPSTAADAVPKAADGKPHVERRQPPPAAAAARGQAAGETRPKAAAAGPTGPPPEFRGPDITLIAGEERSIYEFRQNGQLRMIKVVPKFGKPYYLTPRDPTTGFGDLEQADSLIAEWVLWEF